VAHVDAGGVRYTYRVTETRTTSFRSEQSLAEQRAAVPGRPGDAPTQAMITLSTCLTPEDHAAGNFWSDEHHNPEHRSDKIGVLVTTSPGPG
jgi:sortase A